MSARARERARQLDEAVWRQLPIEDRMCMTGDGNFAAGPGTALCIHCENRPYGERKLRASDDIEHGCQQCWGRWLIWVGNAWAIDHVPPGLSGCEHSCHADEIWLAAS
jgi:hypothetical protein